MNTIAMPHLSTRYLFIAAVAFLLLGASVTSFIGSRNSLKSRNGAPLPIASLGSKPVLQIELAWEESQLEQIFLAGSAKVNLHDATVGNNLDTFLFIPSYAGLLITVGLLIRRFTQLGGPLPLLILLLVPIIAGCDWAENYGISKTIQHFETQGKPDGGDAVGTSNVSLIKWSLTALLLAALGIETFYTGDWRWWPLAALLFLTSVWISSVLSCYARQRWG